MESMEPNSQFIIALEKPQNKQASICTDVKPQQSVVHDLLTKAEEFEPNFALPLTPEKPIPILKTYVRKRKFTYHGPSMALVLRSRIGETSGPCNFVNDDKEVIAKKKGHGIRNVYKRKTRTSSKVRDIAESEEKDDLGGNDWAGSNKKRPARAKVFLGQETNRELSYDDKEWQKETDIFRGRALAFIAWMNPILGNRRFSNWKGSVVDSVVGAFLTQNVSDSLSSSAYMSLAATFPLNSEKSKKRKRSVSRSKNVQVRKISKRIGEKMFDFEALRKEALATHNATRSGDTLDSLDWEKVRKASVNKISNAIQERGMNNVLAQRIKNFLNDTVHVHGNIDLEWLRYVPQDKAKYGLEIVHVVRAFEFECRPKEEYLGKIYGIGIKSVECISLLTLHHRAFPVDTNVARISVRLGWVPLQPLPESLQLHLLKQYPIVNHIQEYLWPRLCSLDQQTLYELHYHMITFGKVFCTKSKPNCNACPMRGECKHFKSAFASARLALPGPERKGQELSLIPQPSYENISNYRVPDIEDAPIYGSFEVLATNQVLKGANKSLKNDIQEYDIDIEGDIDMSKALVALPTETSLIPMPKLKNVDRLRTKHQVYELPDSHPLLEGMDRRVPDDPCSYLLAIWNPGETSQSTQPPQSCQDSSKLCGKRTCSACESIQEARDQIVRGTILIPCRTAMKGSFPLNGTYFQVNEVFADHESSCTPIDVPRGCIWNLVRRAVYFGSSITSIFRGLTMEQIQDCFLRGYVCVRGFERSSRAPKPLYMRLHFAQSQRVKNQTPPTMEENSTSSKMLGTSVILYEEKDRL